MFVEKIVSVILRFRLLLIVISIALTLFLADQVRRLRILDDPNRWLPKNHPNAQLNQKILEEFGGSNVVTIQVEVKKGDIFNTETLQKIKDMTYDIENMDGVVPYYLLSLASRHVYYLKGHEDALDIGFLMENVPQTKEEWERIKYGVYHNPTIYGGIVSTDAKSTLIMTDFWTDHKTTPTKIYKDIKQLAEKYEDANHIISYAGTPIIIGWVNSDANPRLIISFIIVLVAEAIILWFSFRNFRGVIFPITLGIVISIWAFGLQSFFMGRIVRSSSLLVVPFILLAASACHSVQFLKRFFDEDYPRTKDANLAVKTTTVALFMPWVLSLTTDWAAFFVVAFIPFENVRVVGSVGAFGLLSLIICMMILLLPLLSYIPGQPKEEVVFTEISNTFVDKLIHGTLRLMVISRFRWLVMAIFLIMIISSLSLFSKIHPGQDNTYAIHNYLTKSWHGNKIYEMEKKIEKSYGTIFPCTILIEADKEKGLKKADNIKKIDELEKFLSKIPNVGGCLGLPIYVKLINRFINGEKEEYWKIPDSDRELGFYLSFYDFGEPGSFDSVVNYNYTRSVVVALVSNTTRETVTTVIDKAREYVKNQFNGEHLKAYVAGGFVGINYGFNELVYKWLVFAFLLSAVASYNIVLIIMRSYVAGLILLLPLLWHNYMDCYYVFAWYRVEF